jgi:hypothetical protein
MVMVELENEKSKIIDFLFSSISISMNDHLLLVRKRMDSLNLNFLMQTNIF